LPRRSARLRHRHAGTHEPVEQTLDVIVDLAPGLVVDAPPRPGEAEA
jgi:hypothetical protein